MKQNSVIYLCSRKKADLARDQQLAEEFCRYSFTICKLFSDRQSRSVQPSKRPGYQQMLQYLQDHHVSILVVPDLGAICSNPFAAAAELRSLSDLGVAVYWVSDDFLGNKRDAAMRREATDRFLKFMDGCNVSRTPGKRPEKSPEKQNSKTPGRPRALDKGKREALIELRRSGTPISQLCRMFDISRSTAYKILAPYPELKGTWMGKKKE